MPATTDFWVNQSDAPPLFVVTAPAHDDLLAMLRREILPEARRLGDRRVTLRFDREGWSPKFFRECHGQGFDVLTYRKGAYAAWPRERFQRLTPVVDDRIVEYDVAEQPVEVLEGFPMREMRRVCANGHQSAILTTRQECRRRKARVLDTRPGPRHPSRRIARVAGV